MTAPAPDDDIATAAFEAGERVLASLAAGDFDAIDFDAVLQAAQARGAHVARLGTAGEPPDPAMAARFVQQDEALAHRLAQAHAQLAEALRQSGRVQHAAGRYAAGAPTHARLQARG